MHPPALTVRLKKGVEKNILKGSPWALKHEVQLTSELELCPPGSLAGLVSARGEWLGLCYVNPRSHILARLLTRKRETIDTAWFAARFEAARAKRDGWFGVPYYRLIHAEADGLPGLIVERFGDLFTIQSGTAGMDMLQPLWLEALEKIFSPQAILLKNDAPARIFEGLEKKTTIIKGTIPPRTEVLEHGTRYVTDLGAAQKTGWYYDMRANRQGVAQYAAGKSVLDLYCNAGGFGIAAARAGASQVMFSDRSALALELAKEAASLNGVADRCTFLQSEAFLAMEKLALEEKRWDIVITDPPPFVKSRKDVIAGLKGYRKVARLAAALAAPDGLLFIASCSHHAGRGAFHKAVLEGVADAGRSGKIIATMGADKDHPIHPALPQSEYLKAALIRL